MGKFQELGTTMSKYAALAYAKTKEWTKLLWEIIRRPIDVAKLAMLLSAFTLVAYNIPLVTMVVEGVDGDFNGVLICVSVVVLLLVLNFLLYYLLLYCFRVVGKYLIAFTFIGNAISLYFINTYNVLITKAMMGNVFNTRLSEAEGFFSFSAVLYFVILGVIPAIYIIATRIDYRSIWRFLASLGITLAIVCGTFLVNKQNILWIDYNATRIGGLAMPYCYTVNTVRYINQLILMNREETPLPDAEITTDTRDVVVLVIGESARSANFSLYGYKRCTNPMLEQVDELVVLDAKSAYTYTTDGVKAIIDHKPTDELYEILPNYLFRNGVDVIWRTSNWGEPPLHIDKVYKREELGERYGVDSSYDGALVAGLAEEIMASDKDKTLVIIHTSTSHGPEYYKRYPSQFKQFTPVCTEVEMSKANRSELINAYDNTILYTDHMLYTVIEELRSLPADMRRCMIYISDHGESLGEGGVYMHGLPMDMAPREQYEIPFIVWNSDPNTEVKPLNLVGQYHIFHSVMSYLGVTSPIFNEAKNIFTYTESLHIEENAVDDTDAE